MNEKDLFPVVKWYIKKTKIICQESMYIILVENIT